MNIYRRLIFIWIIASATLNLHAQDEKSKVYDFLRIGIGFSANYIEKTDFLELSVPHVFLEAFRELESPLNIGQLYTGVIVGGAGYSWVTSAGDKAGNIFFANLGVMVSYFYPLNEKFKPYTSVAAIYNYPFVSFEPGFENSSEPLADFSMSLSLGAQYELSSKLKIFAEAGTGQMNLRVGINIY